MHIVLVGLNHKTAPVEVRERLAFSAEQLPEALRHAGEAVILSTCNRTEIYAVASQREEGAVRLARFLATYHDLPEEHFAPFLFREYDLAAVRQLFNVACGVDSMIVGEPQVLGQVRQAYDVAVTHRAAGPVLAVVFRKAIAVGKRARTETGISRNAVSVSYAAVELARKIFGSLCSRQVLIIGAGETGELTAKTLLDCGAKSIIVANRTRERAEDIAQRFGGSVLDFAHLPDGLLLADIVISSTSAPHFILRPDTVRAAMQQRHGRALFLIDIAVPRDIDPQVQQQDNVFLYDIDSLQAVCAANLEERRKEVDLVSELIESEVTEFAAWWGSRQVVPTISALCQRAEDIRQAEIQRSLGRFGDLSDRQRTALEALTLAIVRKMLHQPITRLKVTGAGSEGADRARVLRELFALEENI